MIQKSRPCAYGVLVREGRILLCRLKGGPWDGAWTLPGGGIEFGEHPEQTLSREIMEETGYEVTSPRLAKILSHTSEQDDVQYHVLQMMYFAEISGGSQTNEIDGTTDLCSWMTVEEARSLRLVPLAEEGMQLAFEATSH